ncbi:hypothetical protein FA13DRAFT_891835 [Coprinellus micaceus]|uniref:Peptidase C14 caspase domain-containing protein n=1 Tax=Coprinellus micaceus TaxID=71717 RepID=A0A4Y7TUC9_COPMI|nr:hypothetical protein FA13DRAFT_891835 [Coprinellus micaceus]
MGVKSRMDDPRSPIVLEKVYDKDTDKSTSGNKKCSYGIGWSFSSLTADDMHALVIGIDSYQMWGSPDELCELSGAVSDATDMAKYLEEKLRVPCHQIRTLYNSDATKEHIVEELRRLNHRVSVAKDAPIVIYYAGHSQVSAIDNCTYLVPSLPNIAKKVEEGIEGDMLKYGDIVELLRQIGNEKTDNIVLILDTCHAGAMAQGGTSSTSNGIPRSPSPRGHSACAGCTAESGSRILRENGAAAFHTGSPQIAKQGPKQRSTARSRAAQAKARDILTGHPSHVLLAAAAADQQAYESTNGKGGQFTAALLYVLSRAEGKKTLKTMTYKDLIGEVSDYDVRYGTVEKPLQNKNLESSKGFTARLYIRNVRFSTGCSPERETTTAQSQS